MRDPVSLKKRLLSSLWLLLFVGVLLPFWHYHGEFKNAIVADSEREAVRHMDHLCRLLAGKSFQSIDELRDWLSQTADQLETRLTYIGLDGNVLADSILSPEQIQNFENLSARPSSCRQYPGIPASSYGPAR